MPAEWDGSERFPTATVWVHGRGATASPTSRGWSRAYVDHGPETTSTLFGPVRPVAAQRIQARRRRPHRHSAGGTSSASHTRARQAITLRCADSVDRRQSSPATRSASTARRALVRPATPPPRLRPRARARLDRGASATGARDGSFCSRTSRSRPTGRADLRPRDRAFRTWTEAVGVRARTRSRSRIGTTRSTRSCASSRDVARPTAQTGARPRSTCRRWRRCPASGLNAMGILGLLASPARRPSGADQAKLSRAPARVERARVVTQDLAELAQRVGIAGPPARGCSRSRTRRDHLGPRDVVARADPAEHPERLVELALIGERARGHDHGLRLRGQRDPRAASASSASGTARSGRPSDRSESAMMWF